MCSNNVPSKNCSSISVPCTETPLSLVLNLLAFQNGSEVEPDPNVDKKKALNADLALLNWVNLSLFRSFILTKE